MSDLQNVDGKYCHGRVDTEALEAREDSVGPNKEGDDISEGGDGDRHAGVPHCLAEPLLQGGGG